MNNLPPEIEDLANKREQFKSVKQYQKSDNLRKIIEKKGYAIEDTPEGQKIIAKVKSANKKTANKNSLIAVFGSGELSPTGRRVHEYLIRGLTTPVKIALLETPTGFEANPHYWYDRLLEMMLDGLQIGRAH